MKVTFWGLHGTQTTRPFIVWRGLSTDLLPKYTCHQFSRHAPPCPDHLVRSLTTALQLGSSLGYFFLFWERCMVGCTGQSSVHCEDFSLLLFFSDVPQKHNYSCLSADNVCIIHRIICSQALTFLCQQNLRNTLQGYGLLESQKAGGIGA